MHLSLGPRRALATFFVAGALVALASIFHNSSMPYAAWGWLFALGTAGFLLHRRALPAQLFSRAILWSNLVFAGLLGVIMFREHGAADELLALPVFGLGVGGALLLIGQVGLEGSRRFAPVAYRGTLLAVMVMAFADALTLLFWGSLVTEEGGLWRDGLGVAFLGASVVMGVCVLGLYRLSAWAFALNIIANIVIAIGAWTFSDLPLGIQVCLTSTAVAQLLIGLPLLRAIGRGATPPPSRARLRAATAVGVLTIVGLSALPLSAVLYRWLV